MQILSLVSNSGVNMFFCFFSFVAELIREFELIGSSDPYMPDNTDMDTAVVSILVPCITMLSLVASLMQQNCLSMYL